MKTRRIKIFVTAKKNLVSIDLDANKRSFHRMQSLHVVKGFLAIALQCLYLVYDTNTVREYMSSIFMTTFGILVHIAYWNAIFKTTTIYELIGDVEKGVNESELKNIVNFFSSFW